MGSSIRRNPTLVKINEEIGRNIHRTRTLLQLTQLDVGHIIDVRPQQIQKYESGKDAISAARLYLLSTYMKVPPANFFQSSHERPEWEEYVQDSETVSILMKLRYMPIEQKRALNAFLTLQMAGYL